MLEERPLPIVLFDQDPPHDHPARRAKPRRLIGYLAHPLLYCAQLAKPSGSGFLLAAVRRAHVTRRPARLLPIGSRNKGFPTLFGNRLDKRRTVLIEPTPDRKVGSRINSFVVNIGSVKVAIPTHDSVYKMALTSGNTALRALPAASDDRALPG